MLDTMYTHILSCLISKITLKMRHCYFPVKKPRVREAWLGSNWRLHYWIQNILTQASLTSLHFGSLAPEVVWVLVYGYRVLLDSDILTLFLHPTQNYTHSEGGRVFLLPLYPWGLTWQVSNIEVMIHRSKRLQKEKYSSLTLWNTKSA